MEIARLISKSDELTDWICTTLQNLEVQGDIRSRCALGCLDLAQLVSTGEFCPGFVDNIKANEVSSEPCDAKRSSTGIPQCREHQDQGHAVLLRHRRANAWSGWAAKRRYAAATWRELVPLSRPLKRPRRTENGMAPQRSFQGCLR